jgi:uncharacterized membrane protein
MTNFIDVPALDLIALVWFVVLFAIAGFSSRYGRSHNSLTGAVQQRRHVWMQNMVARDNRMMDVVLLQMLSASNTFFASTSVLLLGGMAALLGSGERVQGLLERLPFVMKASPEVFEMKILFQMALFVYAFFKFAWAFRLTHYTAIMIGATPLTPPGADGRVSPDCAAHAEQVAVLAGLSAEHASTGLRTYYFAIGGILWFFHPGLFMLATAWVLAILMRREFFSRSRRAIAPAPPIQPPTAV